MIPRGSGRRSYGASGIRYLGGSQGSSRMVSVLPFLTLIHNLPLSSLPPPAPSLSLLLIKPLYTEEYRIACSMARNKRATINDLTLDMARVDALAGFVDTFYHSTLDLSRDFAALERSRLMVGEELAAVLQNGLVEVDIKRGTRLRSTASSFPFGEDKSPDHEDETLVQVLKTTVQYTIPDPGTLAAEIREAMRLLAERMHIGILWDLTVSFNDLREMDESRRADDEFDIEEYYEQRRSKGPHVLHWI